MSSIKDQIRQEIERRKDICQGIFERESDTYYQGKAVAYGELLPFIDSLPEEKQSEDLEEAAKEYVKDIPTFKDSCLMKAAFEDGWLCSKEKMLKDAVEGKVWEGVHGIRDIELQTEPFQKVMKGLKEGDKVKIIIIKDND